MCAGVVLSLSGYQSLVGSRKNSSNFPLHKSTIRQKLSATRSVLGVQETASLVFYFSAVYITRIIRKHESGISHRKLKVKF